MKNRCLLHMLRLSLILIPPVENEPLMRRRSSPYSPPCRAISPISHRSTAVVGRS
jgi:hypothetical protein